MTYSPTMARKLTRERPTQGAHLLKLRLDAGMTQWELANALGENQSTIALWERSENPPRSEILPRMAGVLGVAVQDLIASAGSHPPQPKRQAPPGKLRRAFEAAAKLPRSQQDKIVDVVLALVRQYQ